MLIERNKGYNGLSLHSLHLLGRMVTPESSPFGRSGRSRGNVPDTFQDDSDDRNRLESTEISI